MAFSNQLLVRDNSTFANYSSWATFMSEFMLTLTWTQTPDTGQVQWLGVSSFSSVTNVSGNTWRYAYSGLTTSGTATAFRVGRSVTITGFTGGAAGNNGTFVITSLAGGAGTFDVVNPSGANSIAGAGVITKQTTVPTTGNYVYEIWTPPTSALTPFYFKLEYGNQSTNEPRTRTSLSSKTDGAGNLIGFVSASYAFTPAPVTSTSTTFNCYAAGDSGAVHFSMWRDDYTNNAFQVMAIQRGYNNSGSYSSSSSFNHVTIIWIDGNTANSCYGQQTVHLTKGVGYGGTPINTTGPSLIVTTASRGTATQSDNFSGSIGVYPIFPSGVGGVGCNPLDIFMVGKAQDFFEGATYTIPSTNMPYGVSHQYVAIAYRSNQTTSVGTFHNFLDGGASFPTLLVRAD